MVPRTAGKEEETKEGAEMSLYSFFFPQRAMIKDNKDTLREAWRDELIKAMLSAGMSKGHRIEPNYTLFYSEKRIIIRKRE